MSIPNRTVGTPRDKGGREAGGQHQGLRQPDDDQRVEQALDDVGLEDQGDAVEDQLRDRRGSGVPSTDDVRSDSADDERNEHR